MIDFVKYLITEEGLGTQLFGAMYTSQKLRATLAFKLRKFGDNVEVITGQTYGNNAIVVVGVNLAAFNQSELTEINQIIENNHPAGIRVQKQIDRNQNTLEYHFI